MYQESWPGTVQYCQTTTRNIEYLKIQAYAVVWNENAIEWDVANYGDEAIFHSKSFGFSSSLTIPNCIISHWDHKCRQRTDKPTCLERLVWSSMVEPRALEGQEALTVTTLKCSNLDWHVFNREVLELFWNKRNSFVQEWWELERVEISAH